MTAPTPTARIRRAHPYQEEAIAFLCEPEDTGRPRRWSNLVCPTGSGKSLMVLLAAARARHHFKGVLIVTPRTAVEGQFVGYSADVWQVGSDLVQIQPVQAIRDVGTAGDRSQFVLDPRTDYATTSAMFARLADRELADRALLSGWLIIADEGHHSGENATSLYDLLETFHAAGATIWTATATPWRSDGAPLFPRQFQYGCSFNVPYSRYAAHAKAPARFRFRTVSFEVPTEDANRTVLTDADLSRFVGVVLSGADPRHGLRPTLVRIQAGSDDAAAVVTTKRLLAEFKRRGVPNDMILDTVGEDGSAALKLLAEDNERAKSSGFQATRYRIVISCGRVNEGVDWVSCSRVVTVGLPVSLVLLVQIVGRGTRSKGYILGYPDVWGNEVEVICCVPRLTSPTEQENQTARTLLIAAMLEDTQVACEYGYLWEGYTIGLRLPKGHHGRAISEGLTKGLGLGDLAALRSAEDGLATLAAVAQAGEGATIGAQVAALQSIGPRGQIAETSRLNRILMQMAITAPNMRGPLAEVHRKAAEEVGEAMGALVEKMSDAQVAEETEARVVVSLHAGLIRLVSEWASIASPLTFPERLQGYESLLDTANMRDITEALGAYFYNLANLTDQQIMQQIVEPYRARYRHSPAPRNALYVQTSPELAACGISSMQQLERSMVTRNPLAPLDLVSFASYTDWITPEEPPADVLVLARKILGMKTYTMPTARDLCDPAKVQRLLKPALVMHRIRNPKWPMLRLELAARRGWSGFPGGQTLKEALGSGAVATGDVSAVEARP